MKYPGRTKTSMVKGSSDHHYHFQAQRNDSGPVGKWTSIGKTETVQRLWYCDAEGKRETTALTLPRISIRFYSYHVGKTETNGLQSRADLKWSGGAKNLPVPTR